jgi:cation:H+ antiporter
MLLLEPEVSMEMLTWVLIALAGFGLSVAAGRWAVQHAAMLASGLSIPPFLLGVTFFALGTDFPEIANSVMASTTGHGDLNIGDSVGSVVTQITLILGILPFAGGRLDVGPGRSAIVPSLTVAALAIGAILVRDGQLSRADAAVLILTWVLATAVAWRYAPPLSEVTMPQPTHHKAVHALVASAGLLLVAAGAGAAVRAMAELSALAGIPEYLISFFGSSIGTSLPELVVTIVALRQGQRDIALGDIFGACLMDSTLSIGAGPLIAPTAVTAGLAIRGAGVAIAAMLLAALLIWSRQRHDRLSGVALLAMYAAAYWIL